MRLKKLEIHGFKSFADKIVLEFIDGIIAIVGPNGCGKSNIIDAFRWVMGTQSARAIRGDTMVDLIFAGSSKRKALNMAEVTLTFTDVGELLPLKFDEISICRKLFRNGESQYFINRSPVRLKDIESLFWDTGLGKNAFCIFEQGKIDEIIHDTPLERRSIFEEAAGILRFKQRRKEALRHLQKAEENCARAEDIHREVKQQRDLLERQAGAAQLYKMQKQEVELIDKTLFIRKGELLHAKIGQLRLSYSSEAGKLGALTENTAQLEREEETAKLHLKEKEVGLKKMTETLLKSQGQREVKLAEKNSLQSRLLEADKKEQLLKKEIEELLAKRAVKRAEFEKIEAALKLIEIDFQAAEKEHLVEKTACQTDQSQLDEKRNKQKEIQASRLQLAQLESKVRSQLQEQKLRFENGQEKLRELEKRQDRQQKRLQELAGDTEEKRKLLEQASSGIDREKLELKALENELNHCQELQKQGQEELKKIQKEKIEQKARQQVLVRMHEDFEGLSNGSKKLLKESQNKSSPLFGKLEPLYTLLEIPPNQKEALATILQPYLQTLVVKTWTDFQVVIAFAKQHQLKDYSLICLEELESFQGQSAEQKQSLLSHFIKGVALVEEGTFGRNSQAWASADGYFKDSHTVLFAPLQGEKNLFLREAELKELTQALKRSEQLQIEKEGELAKLEAERLKIQGKRAEKDKALRSQEMKLVEINFGLQSLLGEVSKTEKDLAYLLQERQKLQRSVDEVSSFLLQWIEKEGAVKQEAEEKQKQFQESEVELGAAISAKEVSDQRLKISEKKFKQISDEKQRLFQACQMYRATDSEHELQLKKMVEEQQSGGQGREKLLELGKAIEDQLLKIVREIEIAQSAAAEREQEVAEKQQQLAKKQQQLKTLHTQLKEQVQIQHRAELLLKQEESSLQSIEAALQEQYHLSIEELLEDPPAEDLSHLSSEQLEKKARQLRHELENAEDINLASIEEFEACRLREESLHHQLQDLKHSREELIQVISKLDRESRKLFTDTFMKIRGHFQKNFQTLFQGGEADLVLTESNDILEAGIEISAKPPGKQMRSISLLSGGEKCLTAMALLFAIFAVKPSAFCLLDEVDAPLDETNVGRFTAMLKEFMDKTQFVMVTHNKKTMAAADMLYGVSMEEKGVSKLLSLSFESSRESA